MEKRDAQDALQAWAICALARWAKVEPNLVGPPVGIAAERLSNYGCALRNDWKLDATGDGLLPIFSLIELPPNYEGSPYHPGPVPTRRLNPADLLNNQPESPSELWRDLAAEYEQLPTGKARFEAFGHLLHKYAWAVPCTYGEKGVSLYQEFKALAGLMAASAWGERPAERYTLVGGDLSGIQGFIYTITSKGAAKGLRGRSFFLQLIGDAVVRRLVADLNLCWANVVYQAGGNFMLLAPDGNMTTQVVDDVRRRVNALLMKATQADLYLVMTSRQIERAALFDPERFLTEREQLGKQFEVIKRQPLAGLETDWATTFEPQGRGSALSCAVCHTEVDLMTSKPLERTGELREAADQEARICYLCDSFGQLASEIASDELYMAISLRPDRLKERFAPEDGWRALLAKMTGYEYQFCAEREKCPQAAILAINDPGFLTNDAIGFRVLANVTPRIQSQSDLDYLKAQEPDDMNPPKKGDIRSFNLLAHAASESGAIERVGVLRMDLDGLGHTFSDGVPKLTLPVLSALSEAFDLFIGGYLNTLAHKIGGNDVYIIYAGGDDLFIVGAWHRLPDLADAIQRDFKTYTGQHPALSISGGLTLEGAHFPLYRAAERSAAAEHAAKDYTRPNGDRKNAFCFLGMVVGWEDWKLVREQKNNLLWLIGEDASNLSKPGTERDERLSRSLLQLVQNLHALYRTGLQEARKMWRAGKLKREPQARLYLGRWVWMQAYALTRMARTSDDKLVVERLQTLRQAILSKETIRLSGLAARWAELMTRKEE